MGLRPDLLQLKPREGNLHDVIGELGVLVQFSDGLEEVLLRELVLPLEILDLGLRCLILFSKLLYYVAHIVHLLLEVLVLFLNE